MKIVIHHRPGSFSTQWIEYCEEKGLEYILVNAHNSEDFSKITNANYFLWHYSHVIYQDAVNAKGILEKIEQKGVKVYPNHATRWHFDDKIAQKTALEDINAPLVPTYVFFEKEKALNWIENTNLPKVFKLKGGAGAINVKLIRTKEEGVKLINQAFGKGFPAFDGVAHLKERWGKFRQKQESFTGVLKGVYRLFVSTEYGKNMSPEKGYVYFQDFIPNNKFDLRIVVVGDKAVGERRFVRENDFRASGSGRFSYDDIPLEVVKTAFEVTEKLKMQSIAFDFVLDEYKNPLIIEISYGFGTKGIMKAPGYWTKDLQFHKEKCEPQKWIIENLIKEA